MRAVSPGSPASAGPFRAPPEVYPFSGGTDLLGRMPVRLTAENDDLVAYGFGNQRIAIPAAEIGAIYVHRGWGKQWGRSGPALVVLDSRDQMLLRAPGTWGAAARGSMSGYTPASGGFGELCASLGIDRPEYPATAAVAGQISRSPWHGAPTGNVVSGGVLTLALVPLTWVTVRRIRNARRESREGMFQAVG